MRRAADQWLSPPTGAAPLVLPPLWFVGVYQDVAGDGLVEAPRYYSDRSVIAVDEAATRRYRDIEPVFAILAERTRAVTLLTILLATGLFVFNTRRWPPLEECRSRSPSRTARRLRMPGLTPTGRAGWAFTVDVMQHSKPHRLRLAVASATAIAVSLATLGFEPGESGGVPATWVLAIQLATSAFLVLCGRRLADLPAQLSAAWLFHASPAVNRRQYLVGVRFAMLVWCAAPVSVVMAPVYLWRFGMHLGAVHVIVGALVTVAAVVAVFVRCERLPFASPHSGNVSVPILLMAAASVGIASWILAATERLVMGRRVAEVMFCLGLAVIAIATMKIDAYLEGTSNFHWFEESTRPIGLRLSVEPTDQAEEPGQISPKAE